MLDLCMQQVCACTITCQGAIRLVCLPRARRVLVCHVVHACVLGAAWALRPWWAQVHACDLGGPWVSGHMVPTFAHLRSCMDERRCL